MSARTAGRVAAVCIVAFWATMMTQLLRREVFLPRLDYARMRVPSTLDTGGVLGVQDEWQGIYYKETKVGFIHSTVRELDNGDFVIRNDARISLRLFDRDMKIHFDGTAFVDAAGRPNRLLYTVEAGPARMRVKGRREGETLILQVESAGRTITKSIPLTAALTLSNAITPTLYWPEVEHGKTYTLDVLDPLSLSTRPAKVRVRGRETLAYGGGEVETTVLDFEFDTLTFRTWVSESGVVLRQESDLGWYLLREDRATAVAGIASGIELQRVLEEFATIRSFHRFARPRELQYLRVRLDGVDHTILALEGAHQRLVAGEPGTVEIRRPQPSAASAPALPIEGARFRPYLDPDPFVQSDDPAIVAAAQTILAGETNSWRAAQRIGDWVYANIEKDLLASIPSAVEILETLKGDCNEHTTLFTALARAAGIPTQFAVGIVYNEGRYYYHAWPEVYVGRWVAMDPTFGQAVADATHIKLLEGSLAEQAKLTAVLGRLELHTLADSERVGAQATAS